MSLEPHDATTVSVPAIRSARQDRPATLAEYLANIASRFPDCVGPTGAANPVALAKRESRAMRRFTGHQENRAASTVASPASSERVQAQRAAWETRRAARDQAILDFLAEDFRTSGDVATRFKVSVETAQKTLRALRDEGLIVTGKSRRVTIYRKAGIEAHVQAISVTVRGETFPSYSACARHFGISLQAVSQAVKKGRTDTIGMRKLEAAE